jgi:hypothetical protein
MEKNEEIKKEINGKKSNFISSIAGKILESIPKINDSEYDKIGKIKYLRSVFDKFEIDESFEKDASDLVKLAFKESLGDEFNKYESLVDRKKDTIAYVLLNYIFWKLAMNIFENTEINTIIVQYNVGSFYDSLLGTIKKFIDPNEKNQINEKIIRILDMLPLLKEERYDFKVLTQKVIETIEEYETSSNVNYNEKQIESIEDLRKIVDKMLKLVINAREIIDIAEKQIVEEKLGKIKQEINKNFAEKMKNFVEKILSGASDIIKSSEDLKIKPLLDEIAKLIENENNDINKIYGELWFLLNYLFNNMVIGMTSDERKDKITKEISKKDPSEINSIKMITIVNFTKHVDKIYEKLGEWRKDLELTQKETDNLKRFISMFVEGFKQVVFNVRKVYRNVSKPEVTDVIYTPQEEDIDNILKNSNFNIDINNGIYRESSIKNIVNFAKNIFNNIIEFVGKVMNIVKNYRKMHNYLSEIENELNALNELLSKEINIVKSKYNNNIQVKANKEGEEKIRAWFPIKKTFNEFIKLILTINKKISEIKIEELLKMLQEMRDKLNLYPKIEMNEVIELRKLYDLIMKIEKMKLKDETKIEVSRKMTYILNILRNIDAHAREIDKEIKLNMDKGINYINEIEFQLSRNKTLKIFDIADALEKKELRGEIGDMLTTFITLSENMHLKFDKASTLADSINKAILELEIELMVIIKPTALKANPNIQLDDIKKYENIINKISDEFKSEQNIGIPFDKLSFEEKKNFILSLKEKFNDHSFKRIIDAIKEDIKAIEETIKNNELYSGIKDKVEDILNDISKVLEIYGKISSISEPITKQKIEEISNMFKSKDIKTPEDIFENLTKIDIIGKFIETAYKIQTGRTVLRYDTIYGYIEDIVNEIIKNPYINKDEIIEEKLKNESIPQDIKEIIKNIVDLMPFYLKDKEEAKELDKGALQYLLDLLTYKKKTYPSLRKKSSADIMTLLNKLEKLVEDFGKEYIKFLENANEILKLGHKWFSKLAEAIKESTEYVKDTEIKENIEMEDKDKGMFGRFLEKLTQPFQSNKPTQFEQLPTYTAAEIKKEVIKKIAYYTPNYMTYKEYDLSGNRLKLLNAGNEKFIILSKDKDLKVGDRVEITKYPISKIGIITKKESDTMYKVVFDGMEDLVHILYLKKIN